MMSDGVRVVPSQRSAAIVVDDMIALAKSGLVVSGSISFARWEEAGQRLISFAESSAWWIADWLVYGENSFHDRYREAIQRTSLSYQTLRNYAWVARRFELERRRDVLSFGHHAEVAVLESAEQDYWLRRAVELGWSRNQLRNNVRSSLRERQDDVLTAAFGSSVGSVHSSPESGGDVVVEEEKLVLTLTADQVAQFAVVANAKALSVDEWAISVLETAVSGGN
jgi:hypothetical protein